MASLNVLALNSMGLTPSGEVIMGAHSGDMRSLHEAAASNCDARLAIELFCDAVSNGTSRRQALVLLSQEDEQIARQTRALLAPGSYRQSPASRLSHG